MQQVTDTPAPPPRPADGHKGTFGTVIVVGGCHTMIGAPAICAGAALRTGAGLVKIASEAELIPFILSIEPSATGIALTGSADHRRDAIDEADTKNTAVLAIGPGMGQSPATRKLLKRLLAPPRPVVLDADGLNALAERGDRCERQAPLILTPHPGEFARLAKPLDITESPVDPDARPAAAARLARAHNAVVVLKGRHTVVTDGDQFFINTTGNPALATAGSGDVLTGLTAALLAQHMLPFDAARLAVHTHGKAADLWAQTHGPTGLKAKDLADLIPQALV